MRDRFWESVAVLAGVFIVPACGGGGGGGGGGAVNNAPVVQSQSVVASEATPVAITLTQFWGAESSGWRMAFVPTETHWTYVEGGGRGESLSLGLTIFTRDADWSRWGSFDSFRVTLKVGADKLKDYSHTQKIEKTSFSGNDHGSCWGLSVPLFLYALEQEWGCLPTRIKVLATLAHDELPSLSSSPLSISLIPVSNEKASWSQRMRSLRTGQTRNDVEAILGRARSEETHRSPDGNSFVVLIYPNPEAPAELDTRYRNTKVIFNSRGSFVSYYDTRFVC